MEKDSRKYGVDIVRIIAVILVLTVHFFLNTTYYSVEHFGIGMKAQVVIRNFCMICVPLFMIITGFLNKKTEYNNSFFKSLFNLLIVWFFYSLIEYFTLNIMSGNTANLNIKNLIFSITSFNACGYSWYIEMYIGLYLISPIINNSYANFDEKNRLYLTIIAIGSLILPVFLNDLFNNIIHFPNWWGFIYPIAYYICGKYIADIKPKVKKKTLIFLLILTQIITFSYNHISTIEFNSFTTFASAVIVFLLFYDINIKGNIKKKIIKYISNITLDIYLASSLIDKLLYPIFNRQIDSMGINQPYVILGAPIILITVFTICVIYASIRKLIVNVR